MDIWTNHTPYPFNQLPKTYSFMVRNSLIWRVGYYGQQPRFIHVPTQTMSSLFVSRQVGEAFDHYQPDLVVSVHPLMQLVPLRVLRQQARCAAISSVTLQLGVLLSRAKLVTGKMFAYFIASAPTLYRPMECYLVMRYKVAALGELGEGWAPLS